MSAEPVGRTAKPAVPAVARAAAVLRAVVDADRGMTLSELARAIGAPKSSVLAICTTLVDVGFLTKTDDRYLIGFAVLRLSRRFVLSNDVANEFWRTVDELRPMPQETLVLSVLDGAETTYLASRQGTRPTSLAYVVGSSLPAHCTASGRALLARATREELEDRFGAGPLLGGTERASSSIDDLVQELERTRVRGYGVDRGEALAGMTCQSVALFDADGAPICAVSITVVDSGQSATDLAEIRSGLHRFAVTLAERLELEPPSPIDQG